MGGVYRDRRGARVAVRRRKNDLELRVDGTLASFYARDRPSTGSVWDALAAPLLALAPERRRRVLVLGLGGGSAARLVRALAPAAHVVGVELDAGVLEAARRWLDLDALGLEVVQADAERFLARERRRFDLVLEDVFVGRGRAARKPSWLPEPGLALAARRLSPGGVLASNVLDEYRGVARVVRRLFRERVAISVQDFDNRILVGRNPDATERSRTPLCARELRRHVHAEPLLAEAAAKLSFRTL
jgi:SAM-dependent methyltransferase